MLYGLSPNPYYKKKERTNRFNPKRSLFFVSGVFAIAKVMLFASLIMMLFAKAHSDVMFVDCAESTTSLTE